MPARCMKSISRSSELASGPGIVSAALWRASDEAAKIRRAWRVPEKQDLFIACYGQIVRADRWRREGIGRPRHDRPAAVRPNGAHDNRHAGLLLEAADAVRVVAPGGEQQLQVRARQPFAAAAEHHCGGDAESQRAAAGGGKPADLADEPQAARQLIDRDLVLDPGRDTDREMVGEIGADPWQFVHHLDADRFQMAGRPDARDLQQVGRVDGAAGDDDLTRRQYPAIAAILPKGNPGALPALEQQPRSDRLGLDAHIWASPRLGQKGARRRPAEAPPPRD